MASDLPYAQGPKNIQLFFDKIKAAKIPDALTHSVLYNTFGLKSVNDRSLVALMKKLGFVDPSGKPTATYSLLKNEKEAGVAIAQGVKSAYEALFSANENVQELSGADLKGLVAQVTGADDSVVAKIVATFTSLVKLADFKTVQGDRPGSEPQKGEEVRKSQNAEGREEMTSVRQGGTNFSRPFGDTIEGGFHFNIQIHLPSNSTEETYVNIFSALRKIF